MIIRNVSVWYPKLDPKRPNRMFDPTNPTWELEMRTSEKSVKLEWEKHDLNVRAIVPDDESPMYFRVRLKKRQFKANGEPGALVEVVGADGQPFDPRIIGNGSVCNIKVFQYEGQKKKADGKVPIVSILTGVQVVKLVKYIAPMKDEFGDEGQTEQIGTSGAAEEENPENFEKY